MKNYYEILGLHVSATDQQVKYAFRKLAVAYHPDKNPLPEAEDFFKEVNEAYEILGDPTKRFYYDQLLTGTVEVVTVQAEAPQHRDPAYRRRRQAGYKPPVRKPSALMMMMEGLMKYVRLLSMAGCVWSLVLVLDYLLPNRIYKEKVTDRVSLTTENGHHFHLLGNEEKYFPTGSELNIYASRLFSVLVKVENEEHTYQLNNLASVYRNFVFMPVILLILSLMGLGLDKGTEFRFSVGTVLFVFFLHIYI